MKFKLITVNIILGFILTSSCNLNSSENIYIFPNEENVNYFIVNMLNAPVSNLANIGDTFNFCNARLIIINRQEFNSKGSFFIKVKDKVVPFDPNEIDSTQFKLCYFQNSKNAYFSVLGNAKEYGVTPKKEFENLELRYDLLYFRVGKSCVFDSDFDNDCYRLLTDYFAK